MKWCGSKLPHRGCGIERTTSTAQFLADGLADGRGRVYRNPEDDPVRVCPADGRGHASWCCPEDGLVRACPEGAPVRGVPLADARGGLRPQAAREPELPRLTDHALDEGL